MLYGGKIVDLLEPEIQYQLHNVVCMSVVVTYTCINVQCSTYLQQGPDMYVVTVWSVTVDISSLVYTENFELKTFCDLVANKNIV